MEIKVVRVLFPLIYLNATLPFARELSLKTYSVCARQMSRAIPKRERERERARVSSSLIRWLMLHLVYLLSGFKKTHGGGGTQAEVFRLMVLDCQQAANCSGK
jgi:hypothetical protein